MSTARPPPAISAPPKIYRCPRLRYRSSVTTVVTRTPMVPVTGRAKVRNQCPPVAKLIYSRYQSHRMQITMGSTASMVRMNSAPERFTSSGWPMGSGGKGGSPCCRGISG